MACHCGLPAPFERCCQPILKGTARAKTAEALMRARYTAYVVEDIDFLLESLHPNHRKGADRESTRAWSRGAEWKGLEVLSTQGGGEADESGEVEFVANFTTKETAHRHHERAQFKKHEGKWYFADGKELRGAPVVHEGPRVGRNDVCPCGSNKKYKKCCGKAA